MNRFPAVAGGSCLTFVGEAPSEKSDPRVPLQGKSGARLARLCGVSEQELRYRFELLNLLTSFPGEKKWWPEAASARALVLVEENRERVAAGVVQMTVMLGKRVAKAFGLASLCCEEPLAWKASAGGLYAYAPHPSGKSRWWNEDGNVEKAAAFLRATVLVAKGAQCSTRSPWD